VKPEKVNLCYFFFAANGAAKASCSRWNLAAAADWR
jgi:hypothetical protein